MEGVIIVIAQEGDTIYIPLSILHQSVTLHNAVNDVNGDLSIPLPLRNLKRHTILNVMTFCEKHVTEGPWVIREGDIIGWDKVFLTSLSRKAVLELMVAANFLHVEVLLDITCQYMAQELRGLTEDGIIHFFGVEGGFSPAEKAAALHDHPW